MNKYKKIAMAAVSIVMAATMVSSFAACGGGSGNNNNNNTPDDVLVADAEGNLTINGLKVHVEGEPGNYKLAYNQGTNISVNIIDSGSADRAISYNVSQIAGSWKGVDGNTYYADDLKPAWKQFGTTLGLNFVDNAKPGRSGSELKSVDTGSEWADYNLINSGMSAINEYSASQLLDLSKFLDYMPNYKHFLQEYPIVEWSLKMDQLGGMYYIPYFDGNDDIEKYDMVQKNWVKVLLDSDIADIDSSVSYLDQYKAKNSGATSVTAAVESFMGSTGSWSVATTKADGSGVGTLTVNYDDVITALKDTNSALATAITGAGGTIDNTKGNIVDIQNKLITDTAGAVNGNQLTNVLREYIKVAYKLDGAAYTTLSDVFLSASAGWDVDLLTAIFRCVVTGFKSFPDTAAASASEIYALAGREMKAQRENDLIALAGELYGVRGLESRLEYLYLDKDGTLQDARLDLESYEAAARLNAFAQEGLLYNVAGATSSTVKKSYSAGGATAFMLHDYVQTQTSDGFKKDGTEKSAEEFNFSPILTPVSKWNDGTGESYMRFTESWRSVKNSGVVIPLASVQNANTLSAVLSFVDYLFSNDGQIVGSYGSRSTNGNVSNANGFWYGNNGVEVLNADGTVKSEYANKVETVDGKQYYLKSEYKGEGFMYENVLYQGMDYNGKQIPFMTDNNANFYKGATVGESGKMDTSNSSGIKLNYIGNYTNYARGIVGAALPIGNKDQGFEYQCTAQVGLDGAAIVNVALQNGTIKHATQTIDENNWWYTLVPSALPTGYQNAQVIAGQTVLDGSSKSVGIYNPTSTAGYSNVYIDLAFWGYTTSTADQYAIGTNHATTGDYTMQSNAQGLLDYIKGLSKNAAGVGALERRFQIYTQAWNTLKLMNQA